MTKRFLKRLLLTSGSVILLLALILTVHIYLVTRRTPPDANTRAMARIDFKQDIDQQDSVTITKWLYEQNGVDHVLCNPSARLVVFTFRPLKTSADRIVSKFRLALPYHAIRFMPDKEALKDGCPVAQTSITYKIYNLFK